MMYSNEDMFEVTVCIMSNNAIGYASIVTSVTSGSTSRQCGHLAEPLHQVSSVNEIVYH